MCLLPLPRFIAAIKFMFPCNSRVERAINKATLFTLPKQAPHNPQNVFNLGMFQDDNIHHGFDFLLFLVSSTSPAELTLS